MGLPAGSASACSWFLPTVRTSAEMLEPPCHTGRHGEPNPSLLVIEAGAATRPSEKGWHPWRHLTAAAIGSALARRLGSQVGGLRTQPIGRGEQER
jgi:hypothetical protein